LVLVLLTASHLAHAQDGAPAGEWHTWGGDSGFTRYSPLDQIDRDNARHLAIAWRWPSLPFFDGPDHNDQATPIFVDGVLYVATGRYGVAAIDPARGESLWTWEPPDPRRLRHVVARALAFWRDPESGAIRLLYVTGDGRLVALDAAKGAPIRAFGEDGIVDLRIGLVDGDVVSSVGSTSPPIVVGDVVVVQVTTTIRAPNRKATPGHVRGFDVRTGEQRWIFHTVPRGGENGEPGELGSETWLEESWRIAGNAGVWTMMSADPELGLVYLPVETSNNDFYGEHRPGDNLFAESLVALEAATGKRRWHFQVVHHGIWDYDPPAAPVLADLEIADGVDVRPVQAVVLVTKQGFAFVFDRATGEPVWPIEERPVPQSDVPGERTSPTQPFPTKPPPFEKQGFGEDDLLDFTPELRAEALAIVSQWRMGPLYTPPSLVGGPSLVVEDPPEGAPGNRGTLMLPGFGGGANWGGASLDPETGVLYVPSITRSSGGALAPPEDPSRSDYRYLGVDRGGPEGPRGLPIEKPPWSRITAIDLNRGEILWQVPNGRAPRQVREHPDLQGLGLDFSRMGQMGTASALVTRTLVFVGEGGGLVGLGNAPDTHFLRAYDKQTGEVLAEIEVPAQVASAPMTFETDGRQMIVFASSHREHPGELVALALPEPTSSPTTTQDAPP
jgi:quinoprotein glucose dehydrogenase